MAEGDDIMTKKQLQGYGWLQKSIQRLEEKVLELRTAAEKMTMTLSGELRNASPERDKIANVIAKIMDVEKLLKEQLHESYILLEEIEKAISKLPEREQYLIRARYIDCRNWEEIGIDMGYAWAQIHRIHSKALKILAG